MQFAVKLAISVAVIVLCSQVGRAFPKAAGLIATMPLTTLIVMLWLYADHPGDLARMRDYTLAVLWGIGPSVLFYAVAYVCLRKQVALPAALCAGFAAWLVGAAAHVYLLHGFSARG